ncbi:MAG: TIGR01458 family HAD-type hydrolase, partial [Acidobacteriota bacterium]|nr:TIGR01458 family HAD-type hydrolase [Acidobacteriota bacterium]
MMATLTGLRGLMLDLDGTVYEDNRLIPGAAEAIAALRERGYRLRFVTNTTNKRRETIRDKLHGLGIESDASEIFTAPVAASLMLRRHPEARCWVVTRGDSIQEFQGLRLDEDRPDFV